MKILCIPDVHQTRVGLNYSKEHINDVDKIVCLGDYVDNWDSDKLWDTDCNPLKIIKDWVSFKKENLSKVELLWGNHDNSYLSDDFFVSGHQKFHHYEIKDCFKTNSKYFNISLKLDDWVFSHAGFSSKWVESFKWEIDEDPSDWCNKKFHQGELKYFNWCGLFDGSGDEPIQCPTWIRPPSLLQNMFYKKQIVGHTELNFSPIFLKPSKKIENSDDYYLGLIDSNEHNNFYILDTDNPPEQETLLQFNKRIKNATKRKSKNLQKNDFA